MEQKSLQVAVVEAWARIQAVVEHWLVAEIEHYTVHRHKEAAVVDWAGMVDTAVDWTLQGNKRIRI